MSVLSFLKGAGDFALNNAGTLIAATGPQGALIGSVVNVIAHEILKAEASGAPGDAKKAAVVTALEAQAPKIAATLGGALNVTNQDQLASGVSGLIESVLVVMKATGAVPDKGSQPAAPLAPATAPAPTSTSEVAKPAGMPLGSVTLRGYNYDGKTLTLALTLG